MSKSKTLPYIWKNKWHYLCLVEHIIGKLSRNLYLINTNTLIHWKARFDCQLWKVLWFYYVFWVLLYIIDDYSCLKCFIFTKLSQIKYLINTHISINWHAKCNYKLWKVLWFNWFLWEFQCLIIIHQTFLKKWWKWFQRVILQYVFACYECI